MTQSSKNEFWKKTAEANINIFPTTYIPRIFTDQNHCTQNYTYKSTQSSI